MKNTAQLDPIQTTDPWKDAVEPNKSQEKPLEEQDNTEESQLKVITNEQVTDKKTPNANQESIYLRHEAGSTTFTIRQTRRRHAGTHRDQERKPKTRRT